MGDWIARVPAVDAALGALLLVVGLTALATRHRGGRFRGLPGWTGFWALFAGILVALSRGWAWFALTLLGLLMFAGLRTYFFLAPVRPQDRYAILAAYLTIPLALYPGLRGSQATFLATVPVILFLLFPVLLSMGRAKEGLLDSMGRLLLGVVLFVFCAAHLGLLVHDEPTGRLELFGVLVLAAELPQRLLGRPGRGAVWHPLLGLSLGVALAGLLGFQLAPSCGLVEEDGARAGLLVALAVSMGAVVSDAVMRDLGSGVDWLGRGAFLDRAIPAVYAAPVFFHYLDHFA
jgi:predicted CDP-diglyceride synthetase/phosphatidate cytidylyltransferase